MDESTPTKAAPPPEHSHRRLVELLVASALLLLLLILLFDWNMLRRPIERRVSAATGREFHINGDMHVKLSLMPRITMDRVTLGNLPGNHDLEMGSAASLQFRLHLMPLFKHALVFSEVRLVHPHLLLEINSQGQPNWMFKQRDGKLPEIRDLAVDDGTLKYRNPLRRTDMDFTVRSGDPSIDARLAPLVIAGKGLYTGSAMELEGRVESPLVLEDPARPYRIDLRARAGATSATAKGNLIGPLQMRGFDLKFGLAGPNLALLYPLIGVATPDTPPYHLVGQLTHEAKVWHYDDFTGKVGDSDLSGDVTIETGGVRPRLVADLLSQHLDFDDLSGFLGAPPQTGGHETASSGQKKEAALKQASARVLPDRPYDLEKLRNMDADVKLRARHVIAPSLPVEAMTAHLFVDGAVLRLDPLDFEVAGGQVKSKIRLDARKDVIASSAKIRASNMHLPRLFPGAKLTEDSAGLVGGTLDLAGNGNSVARMLATSDGRVGVMMGRGKISNLLMEYAGLDIAESLKFLLGKDKLIPVRCAFGDFSVSNGLMTSRALAFDTTDTVILGDGNINLRDETLDMKLKPQPKDHSFLALRAPLLMGGTFKNPTFRPDMKRVTFRAVAAVFLATLAPPAALVATFETGPGKDVVCRPGADFEAALKKVRPATN